MRILWTILKVIVGLAIAIPLGIIALVVSIGVLGGLLGLAILALKIACVAFVGYGVFRVARYFLGSPSKPEPQVIRELPAPDPYYEAAMRELDATMGVGSSR